MDLSKPKHNIKLYCFCVFSIIITLSIFITAIWCDPTAIRVMYGIVSVNETEQWLDPRNLTISAYFSDMFQISREDMKIDIEGYWQEEDPQNGITSMFQSFYGGTYTEKAVINEVIQTLKLATYKQTPIIPDDYEIVDIVFLNCLGFEYDRIVLAYRFADRQLCAFHHERCYSVEGNDAFQSYWRQLLSISERHYFHTYKTNKLWIDSYFRLPFDRTDTRLIYYDSSPLPPDNTATQQLIKQIALSTVQQHIQIEWPNNLKDYLPNQTVFLNEEDILYDRYNDIWMAYIRLLYPTEPIDSENDSRIIDSTILIFFDNYARIKCIFDSDGVWKKYTFPIT